MVPWALAAVSAWAQDEAPVLVAPRLLEPLDVRWPAAADPELGAEAVDLLLELDDHGVVTDLSVVSGSAPFTDVAVAAARTAHLSPATVDGVAVPVEIPLHVAFTPPPLAVEGVAHMAGSGAPAAGISLRACDQTVVTDADGRFRVWGVPDGPCTLAVADPGLWTPDHPVDVVAGTVVTVSLYVRPVDDAHVVGTWRADASTTSRRRIDAETVRVVPGSLGDPIRAIQDLPGAVRSPLDTGWLLVRGGDPTDTGVYIDGVQVPLIYHLGGFTSVLNPGLIDHVDFAPGAQGARYGRSTAGVVDVVTRGVASPWQASAGANLIFAGLLGGGEIHGVQAAVAIRRSYLDGVLALVPGITPEEASVAPRFWDWQARASVGRFSLLGLGYDDSIDGSDATGQHITALLATHRVHGAASFDIGGRRVDIRPSLAWEEEHFILASSTFDDRRTSWSAGLRVESVDDGEGPYGIGAGVDALGLQYTVAEGDISRTAWIGSPEPWVEGRVGDADTRLVGGVRLDTLFVEDQAPRFAMSPRLSGRLALTDGLALKADGGWLHQPPPWTAVVGPVEGDIFGFQSSYGGGAGVEGDKGVLHEEVGFYAREIRGIVGFESDGSLGTADGRAYGVETYTRVQAGRFLGWLSLSWARSLRREDPGSPWLASQYDQPISLTVVATYDLGRSWTVAGRWRYASGFVAPGGDNPNAYDVFTGTAVPLTPDASGRLEPFHALDLKVSKRFLLRRGTVDAWLDVENVYDRRIPEPLILGLSQFRIDTSTYAFGLPVLPVFGVEVDFAGRPAR